jgi:hypothetical protein
MQSVFRLSREGAPGIKLGRTDTTLDLSLMAKEAGEKKLFGGREEGYLYFLEVG